MSTGHFIGINRHKVMLNDSTRMEAYYHAIRETIRPGNTVMDLGTGTGILAIWAAQAGASKVYAIEPHDVINVAKCIAKENGVENKIDFIQADSRKITLPEPVDVVITEAMGNFFITDKMQPVLRDIPRHLKSGGRIIPETIVLKLCPVWLPLWQDIRFWGEEKFGVRLTSAIPFALNHAYVLNIDPEFVPLGAKTACRFPVTNAPDRFRETMSWMVEKPFEINGFAGWFVARLTANHVLSSEPGTWTHWGQMVFPVMPAPCIPGDRVTVTLDYSMDEHYQDKFRWEGDIRRGDESVFRFSHDTSKRFELSGATI